jgi:GH43 family beta-xylosidase
MEKAKPSASPTPTYINPVYPRSFPDPYVLKFCGLYYAYATGHASDGNLFQVLHSRDLVNWTETGSAMEPLAENHPFYWAPEVFYDNGRFYLYYSVGNETLMHLRVAVSDRPDGGFVDSGKRLTREDFAIDAHVFIDTDGSKYLFYATDFLEYSHIGTGTVVDRMLDWFTLAGSPTVVTRAKYDWQVYDPKRAEKGGVKWHTVEGPAVLKRKNVYYEMFSGGNWQNTTYGVSFAKSKSVFSPEEWDQYADGKVTLPILRTLPGKVVGPGHNSVVRGPNNREMFAVYHRWTDDVRVMAIDRTDFAGERIFVIGATTTPQPFPFMPAENGRSLPARWHKQDNVITTPDGGGSWEHPVSDAFLCEVNIRLEENVGSIGLSITGGGDTLFELWFYAGKEGASARLWLNGDEKHYEVPPDLSITAYHLIRIDRDRAMIRAMVDGIEVLNDKLPYTEEATLTLSAADGAGSFAGFAVTEGFEETFDTPGFDLNIQGWKSIPENAAVTIDRNEMVLDSATAWTTISRRVSFSDLEFSASLRKLEEISDDWSFGIAITDEHFNEALRFSVESGRPIVHIDSKPTDEFLALQDLFDWNKYHQLRFIKKANYFMLYIDDLFIAGYELAVEPGIVSIQCSRAVIAVDSVKATRI